MNISKFWVFIVVTACVVSLCQTIFAVINNKSEPFFSGLNVFIWSLNTLLLGLCIRKTNKS